MPSLIKIDFIWESVAFLGTVFICYKLCFMYVGWDRTLPSTRSSLVIAISSVLAITPIAEAIVKELHLRFLFLPILLFLTTICGLSINAVLFLLRKRRSRTAK